MSWVAVGGGGGGGGYLVTASMRPRDERTFSRDLAAIVSRERGRKDGRERNEETKKYQVKVENFYEGGRGG